MIKQDTIYYGGDYNPDQWDEETIREDMRLFKLAGVNLVTLPVFSWAKLEVDEGVYDFGWLDAILDLLWEQRIRVCLATPTTAQPAWLSLRYPEVLPVDAGGRKRTHGMRVFFCVNSLKYRERAAAIAEAMAKRYGRHPALVLWHVANEYGTYCYCDTCQARFRVWLRNRYGGIAELNERWNTSFWGRTVYSFDEIMLPTELNDDYRFNPAAQLDYTRFVSDSTAECFLNEYRVLKRYSPEIPVTSNISGYIKKLDQFEMVRHMDSAGWDNYPHPRDESGFIAFKHDIMRGLKGGQSYLLMEQSPNQQNWQPYNRLKRPGEVRLLSYQALAHGADSVLFFQMRQSAAGQEKFHGALISHAGHENTRVFRECARLGGELQKLGGRFVGSRISARVGLLFDWNNWWALENSSGPSRDIDYLKTAAAYYKALFRGNIAVDVLPYTADLGGYDLVLAPMLYMIRGDIVRRLEAFVKNGGTLVSTVMSGLVDENDRCVFGEYPGPLKDLLGIWVEETDALFPDESNTLLTRGWRNLKAEYQCGQLCDCIHLRGAEAAAVYGSDFYRGQPAVTVNRYGGGLGVYVGTQPDEAFIHDLLGLLCAGKGINAPFSAGEGVEITLRGPEQGGVFFLLNHNDKDAEVDLGGGPYTDLLTGQSVSGAITIPPRDVLILEKDENRDKPLVRSHHSTCESFSLIRPERNPLPPPGRGGSR
ncbi:MAG: beta-galactosidase [Treponema sp.]|jgi:beta-galactosidase|nr:beta-galactosidase [Treponema sp.]